MGNSVTAGFRLSAQQERVWAHQQGREGRAGGAVCLIQIEGPLQLPRLQEALRRVAGRHEILRTVFHRQPGLKVPFQVIREAIEPAWKTLSLTGTPAAEQQIEVLTKAARDTQFNLEAGPTLQALLVELASDRHALILSLPALCADARTLHNLVSEIGREYSGEAAGEDPMQYADVVEWQNELLEAEDTRAGRDFWRDYFRSLDLAGLGAVALPFETKTDTLAFSPKICALPLNAATGGQLEAACKAHEVSPQDFLLTCWLLLFSRLTGSEAVTMGCGFDGRKYEELENALGVFAKALPIRFSFQADSCFDAALRLVKDSVSQAGKWQESFAWHKVEGLADPNGVVLPLGFEYSELPPKKSYGDVRFAVQRESIVPERTKLKLVGVRGDKGLTLEFHYDASRFARSSVERIACVLPDLACFRPAGSGNSRQPSAAAACRGTTATADRMESDRGSLPARSLPASAL